MTAPFADVLSKSDAAALAQRLNWRRRMTFVSAIAACLVGRPIHFAWIVAGVIFLVLISGAGIRATPGLLIVPLEEEFGWTRARISLAIGINIFIYGPIGPFAAAAMLRFGVRPVLIFSFSLLSGTVAASTLIAEQWQPILTWGGLFLTFPPVVR